MVHYGAKEGFRDQEGYLSGTCQVWAYRAGVDIVRSRVAKL